MLKKTNNQTGFTIVELLIVIVVIAILAAISIVAYNGIQERAKTSQAQSEMAMLVKAIHAARINTDRTLLSITGSNCTRCDPWAGRYAMTLDRIAAASETNLDSLKDGNPWGNNYSIDENEGEGSTDAARCASKDSLALGTSGKAIANIAIPFYTCPN